MKSKLPYMREDEARRMSGSGAPKPTVYGVIGMTRDDGLTRSLGGLVKDTASGKIQPGTLQKNARLIHSERGITGNISRTHVPGAHYAQIPYPGPYMAHEGHRVS